jgi:hypothetical protein
MRNGAGSTTVRRSILLTFSNEGSAMNTLLVYAQPSQRHLLCLDSLQLPLAMDF